MSDLIGGGPSTSADHGRTGNGRTQAPPGTTGSPNIRGPRDIMRDRVARERRKAEEAAELEERERRRAEDEQRLIELEERRLSAERRAAAAGAAQRGSGEGGGQRGSGGTTGQRVSDNSQRSARTGDRVASGERPQEMLQGVGKGGRAVGGGESAPSARPRPSTQSQQQPRPVQPESSGNRPAQAQAGLSVPGPSTEAPPPQPPPPGSGGAPTRSSFPHAFERWETLSAHWEGLTSFWIRRLEENANEINRDPLSQQLSRQVTDLSAAGANLFHAVVELQRLRASSERKFQRWFFETRAEQERSQEIQAVIEATVQQERRDRAALIAEAVAKERERSKVDKQMAEMKRELQISKEEARRAWEELGRREQEERARTASLREGQPTLVGGVQVVPMMQGVPSRHGSARDQPQAPEGYPAGTASASKPMQEAEGPVDIDIAYQPYARGQRADPADQSVEIQQSTPTARPARTVATTSSPTYASAYSEAPAVQPAATTGFYQQRQGTNLLPADPVSRSEHNPSYGPSVASESALSEEEYEIDAQGQFIRDAQGNKIRYQAPLSDDDDEYDVRAARERELAYLQQYGRQPVSGVEYGQGSTAGAGHGAAPTSDPATSGGDYEGQGYGTGWEAMPRHHHPTRLSDVLEEDERSRTSASQISRRD
jgi:hypothetical protein